MSDTSKNSAQSSTPYSPKTEQEKAEAFRLLDELQGESARQDAVAEVMLESIPKQS